VIFFGRNHWKGLMRWMKERVVAENYISPKDLNLFKLTDSVEEALDIILDYERRVGPPLVVPKALHKKTAELRSQNPESGMSCYERFKGSKAISRFIFWLLNPEF